MLVLLVSSPPLGQAWGWPREGAQELMTGRKGQERERSELEAGLSQVRGALSVLARGGGNVFIIGNEQQDCIVINQRRFPSSTGSSGLRGPWNSI